jgi:hypothetical protein
MTKVSSTYLYQQAGLWVAVSIALIGPATFQYQPQLRYIGTHTPSQPFLIHLPLKMEPTVSSETSANKTQTPGIYPKENILNLEHGENLKSRKIYILFIALKKFV